MNSSQPPAIRTAVVPSDAQDEQTVKPESSRLKTEVETVVADHCYYTIESPRQLKRKLTTFHDRCAALRKKLKLERQRTSRLRKRVNSLQTIVENLQKQHLVNEQCVEMLEQTFSGVPKQLMERIVKHTGKNVTRKSYPSELRAFALTLQFYSTKAYNYVRQHFNLALPSLSAIRRWYQSVNGEPGFTQEALVALKARAEHASAKPLLCSLMIDEMAIRQHVEWNGSKFRGCVDLGSGICDDSTPVATEVLVFMVVSLCENWKIPVGYFFVKGLSGSDRANLVKQCLSKLYDIGVNIVSLTCDGIHCHFKMINELGAGLDPLNLQAFFVHPSNAVLKVHVVFDVCHMLKLLRNTLAECGILVDADGNKIKWEYVVALHQVQQNEGMHLANKLTKAHINFHTQKMKVNLAAQTLSASTSSAIEFCATYLHLPQFTGSEPTVRFLKLIDHLFDILNSRNPVARGFKAALTPSNYHLWDPFLDEAFAYIMSLKDTSGQPMMSTRRKTPFIGFLCAIQTVKSLYFEYVAGADAPVKYLLTYKLSQDHIELFFSAVRSSLGYNNNPTARQFIAAYKRLLIRHEVKGLGGNCAHLDGTDILFLTRDVHTNKGVVNTVDTDILDICLARHYDIVTSQSDEVSQLQLEHKYAKKCDLTSLSEFRVNVVAYVAGYVVKMVRRILHCPDCLGSLTAAPLSEKLLFVKLKDKGGLIKPSESVVKVCEITEQAISRMMASCKGNLPLALGSKLVATVSLSVLSEVGESKSVFADLYDHMFDSSPESNHVYKLIKVISQCYIKIRMHAIAKRYTEHKTGTKVRKQLTKLVLFKHQ